MLLWHALLWRVLLTAYTKQYFTRNNFLATYTTNLQNLRKNFQMLLVLLEHLKLNNVLISQNIDTFGAKDFLCIV